MGESARTDARIGAEYQPEKLEEAILFFLTKANNGHLGKTKLMKLLYFADFDHAEQHGEPITGARYRKLPQGPVPVEALDLLRTLSGQGKIRVQEREVGSYTQYRYECLREPDLSVFNESELDALRQVVRQWEYEPLSNIVAATHEEAPWLAVGMGEDIPYHLARYRSSLGART